MPIQISKPKDWTNQEYALYLKLSKYAIDNNLELANISGSLIQRIATIIKNKGRCPCLREKRPVCPCKECVDEVARDGACYCKLFVKPVGKVL